MEFLVIYLIGYILSYLIGRIFIRKIMGDDYNWECVLRVASSSLGSYISVVILIILYFIIELEDKKPPRWL